jgi:hypothetical protein
VTTAILPNPSRVGSPVVIVHQAGLDVQMNGSTHFPDDQI